MYALLEIKNGSLNELGLEVKGASYYLCDGQNVTAKPGAKYPDDPDIDYLPTKLVGIGSRALCVPTGNIYMFGPSKTWVKYKGVSILN